MRRWLIVGFLSGAAAVLIFHQGALALLHAAAMTPRAPFSFAPTQPFGVPALWSLAFWGGAWGVLLAAAVYRLERVAVLGASVLFGAIFPTLVAWFIVAPLKGQPVAAGFVPAAMLVGPLVNAAWGLGTGLGLVLFARSERRHGAPDRRGPREEVLGDRRRSVADRRFARARTLGAWQ
jgi:hypothetical protein